MAFILLLGPRWHPTFSDAEDHNGSRDSCIARHHGACFCLTHSALFCFVCACAFICVIVRQAPKSHRNFVLLIQSASKLCSIFMLEFCDQRPPRSHDKNSKNQLDNCTKENDHLICPQRIDLKSCHFDENQFEWGTHLIGSNCFSEHEKATKKLIYSVSHLGTKRKYCPACFCSWASIGGMENLLTLFGRWEKMFKS